MNNMSKWLLAPMLAVLFAPAALFAQEDGAVLTGRIEAGAAGVAVSDDNARVNEYSTLSPDDGVSGYEKADIFLFDPRGIVVEGNSRYMDNRSQDHELNIDLKRVLRNSFQYKAFEHQLDHDRIEYLNGATIRPKEDPLNGPIQIGGADKLPAFLLIETNPDGSETVLSGASSSSNLQITNPDTQRIQQTGGAMMKGEDLVPETDFSIVYREWENETEVTFPALPNLTFDLKFRHQEREGTEQSIGMSKCSGCHITGESRDVDEVTEDVTAGVTGTFGLLTLRYAFTDRKFNDKANDPSRLYDPAAKPGQPLTTTPFDNRLGYDYRDGFLPYDTSPDSDKQTHLVKARVDLPRNTMVLANYVNTEIDSSKREEPGIFTLGDNILTTTYDIYGVRAATRLGGLKLTAHARLEELESDDVSIDFEPISTSGSAGLADIASSELHRESVITRDVLTAGANAMYRLGRYTTARLGYEYEEEDRQEEEFGTTETQTAKASLNTRLFRSLSSRLSYTYKDVENPFHLPEAAGVELTENTFGTTVGKGPAYGTTFYSAREFDLSNQPETVHEGKFSTTWAPGSRMAATLTYRYKDEENELNHSTWEQQTHSPGMSLWMAPFNSLSLTLAYNYFDQRSETAFCQGYYDG